MRFHLMIHNKKNNQNCVISVTNEGGFTLVIQYSWFFWSRPKKIIPDLGPLEVTEGLSRMRWSRGRIVADDTSGLVSTLG